MIFRTDEEALFWDAITVKDEYHVPAFTAHDTVVDLGMWIGPFTARAWDCGSRRIFAYEADPKNYNIGKRNVGGLDGVRVFHRAVMAPERPAFMPFPVDRSGFFLHDTDGAEMAQVPTTTLDEIVEETGPVRFLKIDLEGSEWEVLYTFTRWDLVGEIVGEYHEPCPTWSKLERRRDLPVYYHITLKHFLQERGYRTIVEEPKGDLPCALFRAWR